MKLHTALIINSVASLLMIIVWVPLSNVAIQNFNDALEAQSDSKQILQDFINLNDATNSLSLSPTPEQINNWERKYEVATIRLLPQYFQGSTEDIILETLKLRFKDLDSEFNDYMSVLTNDPSDSKDTRLAQSLDNLSEISHQIIGESIIFTDLKQQDLARSSSEIDLFRSTTIIGAFISLTLINFLIFRSISSPIRKLTNIAKKISQGDFRLDIKDEDLPKYGEFGELSDAFLRMTSELEDLYGSLEEKVSTKTKALSETLEEIEQEKEKYETQVLETEKFKLAVDSSTDGIMIVKVDGEIVYLNDSWLGITGYTPRDLTGANIKTLINKKPQEKIYNKIWQGMVGMKDVTIDEVVNARKDGNYYQAQIAIYPIREEGRAAYYVCVQQDITKRKEVDRAKTEFVSLASHQLRTPLSTIGWYTEMLLAGDGGNLTEEQVKLLTEIADGNRRMVNLVNALLNVSRIELGTLSVETKWVNIIEMSESVISELNHQLESRRHKVSTNYDMRLPDIKTDPNLMRIVFQNLLSNSIKYTPEGGQIMVEILGNTPKTSTAKIESIKIVISDNGIGIPGRQQDQLFTKLFRADNVKETDTEGTGLGLYLVKAIVDYANGEISVESKENEGTKFTIIIPVDGMSDKQGSKELITEVSKTSTSRITPT